MERLERRYDVKELPETAQMSLFLAAQGLKEDVVQWADRIVQLALKAYPEMSDRQVYQQAILRFCQECSDKDAGHYALTSRPISMEEALNKVRCYQQSDRVMYGRKKEVRNVITVGKRDTSLKIVLIKLKEYPKWVKRRI